MRLRCGSLSITTPVSLLANEFDVRSVLHGQVSLAAVNQMCVIVSAKMGGSPQRIFEHTIWMVHTAIHKNTLFEDCDNLLFLILTKPACSISLVPSADPLVCGIDVTTTFF